MGIFEFLRLLFKDNRPKFFTGGSRKPVLVDKFLQLDSIKFYYNNISKFFPLGYYFLILFFFIVYNEHILGKLS